MSQPAHSIPDAYADFTPPPPPKRAGNGRIGAIIAATIVTLAGLGVGAWFLLFGTPTLDSVKIEAEIVRATSGFGLTPTDVSCPDGIPVETGRVDVCTATLEGEQVGYTARQTDDQGNVSINSSGFVVVSRVEQMLAEHVGPQAGVEVVAECADGDRVVVGGPGTAIACTVAVADDPSDSAEFTATVTDDEGTIEFE